MFRLNPPSRSVGLMNNVRCFFLKKKKKISSTNECRPAAKRLLMDHLASTFSFAPEAFTFYRLTAQITGSL